MKKFLQKINNITEIRRRVNNTCFFIFQGGGLVAKRTYEIGLSVKEIETLKKQLIDYRDRELQQKIDLFIQMLALEGVKIAKTKIAEKDAIYTGELYQSMNLKRGDIVLNGSEWVVYTDCEWAPYVEFGTGIVGMENPHPAINLANWKYDTNEHGERGWFYFKDGERHWTKGMPSRPFMYETSIEMYEKIRIVAKEVFG